MDITWILWQLFNLICWICRLAYRILLALFCPPRAPSEEVEIQAKEITSLRHIISKKEFLNWIKCVLALNISRTSLLTVVKGKFETFATQFKERDFNIFLTCLHLNKVLRLKTEQQGKRRTYEIWKCDHNACSEIFKELLKNYVPDQLSHWRFQNAGGNIHNVVSSDASETYWKLARLYIYTTESFYDSIESLDISLLIKLLRSCKLFVFDGSAEIYDKLVYTRNRLMHSTDNMVSDQDVTITFKRLRILLETNITFSSCKEGLAELNELEKAIVLGNVLTADFQQKVEKAMRLKKQGLDNDIRNPDDTKNDFLDHLKLLQSLTAEQLNDVSSMVMRIYSRVDPEEETLIAKQENVQDVQQHDVQDLLNKIQMLQQSNDDLKAINRRLELEKQQLNEKLGAPGNSERNEETLHNTSILCKACQTENRNVYVSAFCDDCSEYMCPLCCTGHRNKEPFLGHTIFELKKNVLDRSSEVAPFVTAGVLKQEKLISKEEYETVCIAIFDRDHIIVATHKKNNSLLIFNIKSKKVILKYELTGVPYDMATIVSGEVFAYTMSNQKDIFIMHVTDDMRSMKPRRQIKYKNLYTLIRYSDGRLFGSGHNVLKHNTHVSMFSLNGKQVGNITFPKHINFDDFDVFEGHVFLLNESEGKVRKFSMKGTLVNIFDLHILGKDVCFTGEGHLLVTIGDETNERYFHFFYVDGTKVADFQLQDDDDYEGSNLMQHHSVFTKVDSRLYCVSDSSIYVVMLKNYK